LGVTGEAFKEGPRYRRKKRTLDYKEKKGTRGVAEKTRAKKIKTQLSGPSLKAVAGFTTMWKV